MIHIIQVLRYRMNIKKTIIIKMVLFLTNIIRLRYNLESKKICNIIITRTIKSVTLVI